MIHIYLRVPKSSINKITIILLFEDQVKKYGTAPTSM